MLSHGDFKDLPRGTASDIVLRNEAFNIAKIPKYYKDQCGIDSIIHKFFDKKSSSGAVTYTWSETSATQGTSAIKSENMSNQQLAEEL